MDANEELDFAAGLLDNGEPVGEELAQGDGELEMAAAILAENRSGKIGLPCRSAATAAYARVCRALSSRKEKTAELRDRLDALANRRFVTTSPSASLNR